MTYFERYHIDIAPPDDPWNSNVDPDAWKRDVELQLRKIEGTDAGKALLENITKSTDTSNSIAWIEIRQFNTMGKACNAHGNAIRKFKDNQLRSYFGEVIYEPNQFHKGSYCYEKKSMGDPKNNRGKLPDEVLFHELIHAHRGLLRIKNYDEVRGALRKYTSPEEFLAVVITNIYISDITNMNSSGLRGSHRGGAPLEPELSDSLAFYAASADVFPIISKFADEEWPLFNALANVRARFNPLRALKENEALVREASRSDVAKSRDLAGEKAYKTEEEKRYAQEILSRFGAMSFQRQEPQLKDLAKVVLSPLAKKALGVLKR